MTRSGRVASVAEIAAAAGVSRATAYRYFPTHSSLVSAIVEHSLGPVRQFESHEREGGRRIRDLFDQTFPRFREFEPQLRAALQIALEHWSLARAGQLAEEPYRRGHRTYILSRAAAPLKAKIGARAFDRLLKALSMVYGIESYVVLKDIWGADDAEVSRISRWVVDALVARRRRGANAPRRARCRHPAGPSGRTGERAPCGEMAGTAVTRLAPEAGH
jgi:AcrR family transcriptional regulator